LKNPHDQKGPKRGGEKIGSGSESVKEGAANQKVLFRDSQKGSSNKRPEE
jgi:hypothetical protein